MAVTKTLIEAIPSNKDGKVEVWELTMKYEEGSDATYYTSNMNVSIPAIKPSDGAVNFIPKAEALWTLAELTALCPTDKWVDVTGAPPPSFGPDLTSSACLPQQG